ncbi:MAG: TM2 domain-containing protein [Candidatus Izimaplasma sp.]|nr:TM2 domain-containing protein [Candidatus Izimaplasma bacterium]
MAYCRNCGNKVDDNAFVCIYCGVKVNPEEEARTIGSKSKLAAGLFGIFLGSLGVHNFYLGYTNKAIAQLLLTVVGWIFFVGPLIASVWGLVEGILILAGSIDEDAQGNALVD